MKKIKLSLPVTILLATIILGGFYYASQINKQNSIERQQGLELEQKRIEYVAKRRLECYSIYEKERDEWNNVDGYFYRERAINSKTLNDVVGLMKRGDVCVVRYENLDWEEGDSFEDKYFTKEY